VPSNPRTTYANVSAQPADWDENAPPTIIDETATMPADWLPEEPKMIPDPNAEKPEEWDDEEDGDWVPDMVPNPVCEEVSGCGPWEQPVIKNPAYKVRYSRNVETADTDGVFLVG
jgi:calnexin